MFAASQGCGSHQRERAPPGHPWVMMCQLPNCPCWPTGAPQRTALLSIRVWNQSLRLQGVKKRDPWNDHYISYHSLPHPPSPEAVLCRVTTPTFDLCWGRTPKIRPGLTPYPYVFLVQPAADFCIPGHISAPSNSLLPFSVKERLCEACSRPGTRASPHWNFKHVRLLALRLCNWPAH